MKFSASVLTLSCGLILLGCSGNQQNASTSVVQDSAKPTEISTAERKRRVAMDFPLTEAEVKQELARLIPDYSEADFTRWHDKGLLEYKFIDGEKRYFKRAVSNLFYIDEEARDRRIEPKSWYYDTPPLYQVHEHHKRVLAGTAEAKTFEIEYTLTVDADAVGDGQLLKVWIPYPREIPGQQTDIKLLSASPGQPQIADNTQLQRTAYFEAPAQAGQATEFTIRYEYTAHPIRNEIDPAKVTSLADDQALAPYLAERPPHIAFSDELRALNQSIVGDETSPYRIAQRLFSAVDGIPWASAREYSSIENISHYAATAGHADCGQQTLLLMTLMRMNGIPTRWQSGWEFSDGDFDTMHDWGWFYLEPYGWMPMDVTHGQLASADEALQWFYLGNLDAYRLTFNDDYSQPFYPAKQYTRSETVDSQRGEVEWALGNLYFDQWSYNMQWQLK
jgi:transglutaminase-like putative cysteine protease